MNGPVPARVPGAVKAALIGLVDYAVASGWSTSRACSTLELDRRRLWRWQTRHAAGDSLDDRPPGGNPIHGLLDSERQAIMDLYDTWADVDRSHRKLAHRGSYEGLVWVSPSTVDRVLAANGLKLEGNPRPPAQPRSPWPTWVDWEPNQIWCWDASQFPACEHAKYAHGIVDVVSKKWLSVTLGPNPDSVAARVLFIQALQAEELWTDDIAARVAALDDDETDLGDVDGVPLLLALSDNGTEMRAKATRRFMAACAVVARYGRVATPTDQAWIESLWGHVKAEWPHLLTIEDPAVLAAELERVRTIYNSLRLHEGIGYVTPNDEHQGRGDAIRQARRDGLAAADQARRNHRRNPNQ